MLRYIYLTKFADSVHDNLLAALAIIYSKIIEKTEITDNSNTFPHFRNELACFRHADSDTAHHLEADYIARFAPYNRTVM